MTFSLTHSLTDWPTFDFWTYDKSLNVRELPRTLSMTILTILKIITILDNFYNVYNFQQFLTMFTIFNNFLQFWQFIFFTTTLTFMKIFSIPTMFQFLLQFWTITSDAGQHSQFVRCFGCISICSTYPGQLVGRLLGWSVGHTFRFPPVTTWWPKVDH